MPATPPRDAREDEPLSAEWLNELIAFVLANQITVDPTGGLTASSGPNGVAIGTQDTPGLWIQLTWVGPSGSYSWAEQIPAAGGGWAAGICKGYAAGDPARGSAPADPAWESGGNAGLAVGYRADATRDPAAGRLTFRAGSCPS